MDSEPQIPQSETVNSLNFNTLFDAGKLQAQLPNGLEVVGEKVESPEGKVHYVVWHKSITGSNLLEAVSGVKSAICGMSWDRMRISMSGVGNISQFGGATLDTDEALDFADVVGRHEGAHLQPVLCDGRTGSIRIVFEPLKDGTYQFLHAAARLETIDPSNPLTLSEVIKRTEGPKTLEGLPLGDDDLITLRLCEELLKTHPPETPWKEVNDEFKALKAKPKTTIDSAPQKPQRIDFEVLDQIAINEVLNVV